MYIPRPWHNLLPFSILILSLYVGHNLEASYDVVLFVIFTNVYNTMLMYYIMKCGIIYQNYLAHVDSQNEKPKLVNNPLPLSIPYKIDGRTSTVLMQQTTEKLVIHKERYLAFTLVRQNRNGYKPDLREGTWVRNGMFSRKEFIAVIDKWVSNKIIAKKKMTKTSTYEVLNWTIIEIKAAGGDLL